MRPDTVRSQDDDLSDAYYWRRRAYALTGVLATIGLLAWACSGDGGDEKKSQVRNTGAGASAAPSASSAVPPLPTAMPTVTVTATARVTVTPAVPKRAGDACDPRSVVINMAGAKPVYSSAERPQFRITVVNTGAVACTFDVGPDHMEVRISSGSDRIWSSADCAGGTGSNIQMLRRGVPFVGAVTWDRRRSKAKCAGDRETARKGTYVAVVRAGDLKTGRQVFHLR